MTQLTGHFDTRNGSKYLQQLCKHFGHKIETSHNESEGQCQFAFGTAWLRADDAGLTVQFDLQAEEARDQAKGVIDSHLERFAFREGFSAMQWQ